MLAHLLILLTLAGVCSADITYRTGISLKRVVVARSFATGPAFLQDKLLFSANLTGTPYADFARGDSGFTFTRASVATQHNPSGEVVETAANLPRFGYSSEGILIERKSVNAIAWSEEMENAAWDNSASSSAFHNSQLAPTAISATTADEIRETADDTTQELFQEYTSVANGIVVHTVYLKKLQRDKGFIEWWDNSGGVVTQFFDLDAGTLLSVSATGAGISLLHASIEACTNDWYRCAIAVDTAAETACAIAFGPALEDLKGTYGGDAAKGIAAWGAMVEVRASSDTSFITSYVPAVANGGTRYVDALTYAAAGNLPTSGPFTLVGTMAQPNGLFHSAVLITTDNSLGNGASILTNVVGTPVARYNGPGFDVSGAAANTTAAKRYALTWQTTDARGFAADISDGFDATPTTFPAVTTIRIGSDNGTLEGHSFIKNIRIYSGALSAWELSQVP